MTSSTTLPADREYTRREVERVSPARSGYNVTFTDGWGCYVEDAGIEPEPGDMVRQYMMGNFIRGIAIEGKGTIRYQTEREYRARLDREKEERERASEADELATRPERDLRIRELHPSLRARIEGFQAARSTFRRDYEPYELFVCEEAEKIARHFEGENGIYRLNAWLELPHGQQVAELPLSDEHSGNTFGQAASLARFLLLGNDRYVIEAHGALCPLVGCEDYGCVAARGAAR